jgi:poly-gamma-glutamate synthesis protein (capsule biosynthesis protein)
MGDTLTIGLTGDVMLGRNMNEIISLKGYDYPWGDVLPIMRETDFNVINLETTLTNCNRKVYKKLNFKTDPDKIKSLSAANVKVANLANNHILDFANEGLLETIQTLDLANISHVGAGMNLTEAASPLKIHYKNFSIGLLGLTDNEPAWKANGGAGTNYLNIGDKQKYPAIVNIVEKLHKETDLVIVSIHWGPNMNETPSSDFINFAHTLCLHGVNVVHGHSAHILQGIDHYRNSLILYDTGDFIDDYAIDPDLRNDLSAFFILRANKSGLLDLRIVPVRIFDYQVTCARFEDRDWVIRRLRQQSLDFGTSISEEGRIELNENNFQERDA